MSDETDHVTRVLRALELLAREPRTQAELAAALEINPRTARRLLTRLETEGYAAAQDGSARRYALTLKLAALGAHVAAATDLAQLAVPYVVHLRNTTGEAAHLCVPRDEGVLHLVQESVATVSLQVGETVPYHATAVGKSLLAYLPDLTRALLKEGLETFTPQTRADPTDVLMELAAIREQGYAIDEREWSEQLRCVAAPVFDSSVVVAALGVSAPVERVSADQLGDMATPVRESASALSSTLGHHVPTGGS